MVVDIINKTLDTTAIVKIPILTSPTEPYCILILMVTLRKELALFFGKSRSIRNTNLFPLELNKSLKTVQFNNQLLAGKTKHFLPLISSKLLVEQLIPYTILLDSSSL
jgi:hypothetical protein